MKTVKKNDWIFDDIYNGIIASSPDYKFKQDGIFITIEEAHCIESAICKKPLELDSMEEIQNVAKTVKTLRDNIKGFYSIKENKDE